MAGAFALPCIPSSSWIFKLGTGRPLQILKSCEGGTLSSVSLSPDFPWPWSHGTFLWQSFQEYEATGGPLLLTELCTLLERKALS